MPIASSSPERSGVSLTCGTLTRSQEPDHASLRKRRADCLKVDLSPQSKGNIQEAPLEHSALPPPFDHLRFGDTKKSHIKVLEELAALHPQRDARIIRGDANTFVQSMFEHPFWSDPQGRGRGSRALVFLDPYGLEVKWRTLEVLAASEKADVWFLANLKAAVQQLSRDHRKLDADKRRALGEYFGTDRWEAEFYREVEGGGLLGMMETRKERDATKQDVAAFHRQQLRKLFGYVSEPLPIAVGGMDDYFLLYCMSNNKSPAARALIKKGADWVIQRYKQASRQKSGL